MRIFVPGDAAAVAVGADRVADLLVQALRRGGAEPVLLRNGSRGLFELEPLVEVERPEGRVGYARIASVYVDSLAAALLSGSDHPACVGRVEDLPFLKRQQRLTFARCGIIDPASLEDYRMPGGL